MAKRKRGVKKFVVQIQELKKRMSSSFIQEAEDLAKNLEKHDVIRLAFRIMSINKNPLTKGQQKTYEQIIEAGGYAVANKWKAKRIKERKEMKKTKENFKKQQSLV